MLKTRILHGLWVFIPGLIALYLHTGCTGASPRSSAASEATRFHEWWNFYEQGVERFNQKNFEGAARDFETCLGLRPGTRFGFPQERWRERTYGLHVVENYFPSRELGICRYFNGDYARAAEHLEESLRQLPSARAKYYLNATREKLLAGKNISAPEIVFSGAATSLWTRLRQCPVSGTAAGPGYIKKISVQDQPQFIELAEPAMPFLQRVPLKEGSNTITVEAGDLTGKAALGAFTLRADWRPPQFVIARSTRKGNDWLLEGSCYDDQELQSIRIGSKTVLRAEDSGVPEKPFQATMPGDAPLLMEAADRAGNRTSMLLQPDEYAMNNSNPALCELASQAEVPPLSDAPTAPDRMKPLLRLANSEAITVVYDGEFFLDGEALDKGGLAGVAVNGEEWLRAQDRGAQQRHFSGMIPVEGTNVFTVTATDLAGNKASRTFTVIRQTPEYLSDLFKLRVVIPPLLAPQNLEGITPDQIHDFLSEQIVRPPPRFSLLARGDAWNQILLEQELTVSDLVNPRAAIKVGRLMSADMLLPGAVYQNGQGLTLCMKVINTEDGSILHVDDVYSENDPENLRAQAQGLVSKIERHFPVTTAVITAVQGRKITLNAGSAAGLREGTRMIVVARNPDQPTLDAGEVVRLGEQPAQLEIIRVRPDSCEAKVTPAEALNAVRRGDFACTR
ncbi:MAG: hypothetical protein V2A34_10240 [Lentisphaerota bacterium]